MPSLFPAQSDLAIASLVLASALFSNNSARSHHVTFRVSPANYRVYLPSSQSLAKPCVVQWCTVPLQVEGILAVKDEIWLLLRVQW